MLSATPGLHHVTGIVGDPAAGAEFYGGTLGLRLLRRTVKDRPQLRRMELMRGSTEVP
ncbi:Glyoxalase/Bleomycin resistance protein/Dioxygenase superfamily protein [Halorubrum xinjiangense]|uniref:Glyoxalase/Bleomycin resistance protein/Dioxygenase superfamily protein n=1 Tax=Halorubrum xinjiangense TaxID=261291 RepID=A0A1G7NU97_9EURY|nr:VOC family protein [Halorubrum xinjiangense]SDF77551.1 Glyoxalase/Bleomycin resistance protein/Dioxygenase superfamily protein [Halorubrum xinjiangense]